MASLSLDSCNNCFINACDTPEKQLFVCGHDGCRKQWKSLCLKCGDQSHTNKKVFNHEFGRSNMQTQSQYEKAIIKHDTTTSNFNNATKKTVGLGSLSTVGVYQVGMLQAMKELGIKEGMKKFTKDGWNLTKFGKGTAAGIQVALCVWEIGCELKRYNDGIISTKECERLVVRSITANSVAFGGALAGAYIGGAIGGLPGAALGTAIGGIAGDYGSRYVFDAFVWDDEDAKQQEHDVNEALKLFSFIGCNMENVLTEDEFNRENVQKKYYDLAMIYHPDRPNGKEDRFCEVMKNYNILLGVLKKKEKD